MIDEQVITMPDGRTWIFKTTVTPDDVGIVVRYCNMRPGGSVYMTTLPGHVVKAFAAMLEQYDSTVRENEGTNTG